MPTLVAAAATSAGPTVITQHPSFWQISRNITRGAAANRVRLLLQAGQNHPADKIALHEYEHYDRRNYGE